MHSTPAHQGGLSLEALLQLELRKFEVEERRVQRQWQFEDAGRQKQYELEKSRLVFTAVTHVLLQVPMQEKTAEMRLARSCSDHASLP